jgi:hypothetical protein
MAQYVETACRTFQASAAISQFLRVKLNGSNKLEAAGVGDVGLGTIERAALAANEYHPVRLWTAQGTRKMVAAGAISREAVVYAAASGKIDDTVTGVPIGIALEAATAADDVIEILPLGLLNEQPGNTAGVGITGSAAVWKSTVVNQGGIIKTTMLIDLTGLNSGGTADDIIGADGAGVAHLGQITAALNGTIVGGLLTCLETPATGDDDINVYSAVEATGVEDTAISALDETALCNSGDLTAGTQIGLAAPAADEYIYLTGGTGDSDATYTAGILMLEFWGV